MAFSYIKGLLSVIIPVYNIETYLPRCVKSILTQTYKDIEIILINDGSTDQSGVVCDCYANKYKNIHVIHQKNMGVIRARENGLKISGGEYIGFIDGDDWIECDFYEDMIKKMREKNVDIVVSGATLDGAENRSRPRLNSGNEEMFFTDESLLELMKRDKISCSLCDKIYRHSLFEDEYIWLTYDACYEDLELNWWLFNKAKKILFLPRYKYHYVMRQSSSSHQSFSKKNLSYLDRMDFIIRQITLDKSEIIQVAMSRFCKESQRYLRYMIKSDKDYSTCIKRYQTMLMKYRERIDTHTEEEEILYDIVVSNYTNNVYTYRYQMKELISLCMITCRKYRNVFIYGAGYVGKKLFHIMEMHGLVIRAFVTSDNSDDCGTICCGHNVISVNEAVESFKESSVFILGLNPKNTVNVIEVLKNRQIYNYLDLREYYLFCFLL